MTRHESLSRLLSASACNTKHRTHKRLKAHHKRPITATPSIHPLAHPGTVSSYPFIVTSLHHSTRIDRAGAAAHRCRARCGALGRGDESATAGQARPRGYDAYASAAAGGAHRVAAHCGEVARPRHGDTSTAVESPGDACTSLTSLRRARWRDIGHLERGCPTEASEGREPRGRCRGTHAAYCRELSFFG
jgi:hypothetical protein